MKNFCEQTELIVAFAACCQQRWQKAGKRANFHDKSAVQIDARQMTRALHDLKKKFLHQRIVASRAIDNSAQRFGKYAVR
jgi:ribosome-binding ATPase YchF (GTP1/OBG family)